MSRNNGEYDNKYEFIMQNNQNQVFLRTSDTKKPYLIITANQAYQAEYLNSVSKEAILGEWLNEFRGNIFI